MWTCQIKDDKKTKTGFKPIIKCQKGGWTDKDILDMAFISPNLIKHDIQFLIGDDLGKEVGKSPDFPGQCSGASGASPGQLRGHHLIF